jgi:hypothetical protein
VPTVLRPPSAVLPPEVVSLPPFPVAETRRLVPLPGHFFLAPSPVGAGLRVVVGSAVPPSAVRSAVPTGLPRPVHGSQPGAAEYAPLLPWVMS